MSTNSSLWDLIPMELKQTILKFDGFQTNWRRRFENDVLPDIKKRYDGGKWVYQEILSYGNTACANCYIYGDGTGSGPTAFCYGSTCQNLSDPDFIDEDALFEIAYVHFEMIKDYTIWYNDPNATAQQALQSANDRGLVLGSLKHIHREHIWFCLSEIDPNISW